MGETIPNGGGGKTLRVGIQPTKHQGEHTPTLIERLRALQVWAITQPLPDKALTKVLNLSVKASQFTIADAFPDAHRANNGLDRLMNYQDRILDARQYFHGY